MKDGILFINKPKGLTSRDVVNQISKIYQTKKVGHTGTLDPLATGVLIICLGKYTKLVEELTSSEKEYIATMKLGIKTDTGDITGNILEKKEVTVSQNEIEKSFQAFPKEYIQTVPIYSAVKVNGKKLYEYAREKKSVELPKRKVWIKNLEILHIKKDKIIFKTIVSKGTYIRSLLEDLAKSFNELATMESLVRTKQGKVSLENCLELKDIHIETPLKKVADIFDYPQIEIDEETKRKVENGNKLFLTAKEPKVFITFQEEIIAIYEKQENCYKMIFKVI